MSNIVYNPYLYLNIAFNLYDNVIFLFFMNYSYCFLFDKIGVDFQCLSGYLHKLEFRQGVRSSWVFSLAWLISLVAGNSMGLTPSLSETSNMVSNSLIKYLWQRKKIVLHRNWLTDLDEVGQTLGCWVKMSRHLVNVKHVVRVCSVDQHHHSSLDSVCYHKFQKCWLI